MALVTLIMVTAASAKTITGQETWQGDVLIEEDVLVAKTGILTVMPGTRVIFSEAPSTKTEPSFWHPHNELSVEGELLAQGAPEKPVRFEGKSRWGGLVVAPGGTLTGRHVEIDNAEEALMALDSNIELADSTIANCGNGLVLAGQATATLSGVSIERCGIGLVDTRPSAETGGLKIEAAYDTAQVRKTIKPKLVSPPLIPPPATPHRELLGEYSTGPQETWRGTVIISGRVTVPPESVLSIEPGTSILFRKIDTNLDGLGEGELLVLGGIRSEGTDEAPVVFRSAEESPAPGDWDKVSIIASEDGGNRFSHTVFMHGVQALHSHFSTFRVADSFFKDNLRAIQFQECDFAKITGSTFTENKQAVRFRDSKVELSGNLFSANDYTLHAFRARFSFTDSNVSGSRLGGMLAKECDFDFSGNIVSESRSGLKAKGEGSRATLNNNSFTGFLETALSLNDSEGLITGNQFSTSEVYLLKFNDSSIRLKRNLLGEAKKHIIHIEGGKDLDASENYWLKTPTPELIYDSQDDKSLGTVKWNPPLEKEPLIKILQ